MRGLPDAYACRGCMLLPRAHVPRLATAFLAAASACCKARCCMSHVRVSDAGIGMSAAERRGIGKSVREAGYDRRALAEELN